MRISSITRKLILYLTTALIGFWLLAVLAGIYVMRDEFSEIFDGSLQETAERLTPLVLDDLTHADGQLAPRQLQPVATMPERSYLTYQVRNAVGDVVMHSHDISAEPFPAPLTHGFWQDAKARYFTVSAADGSIFIQVADKMEHRDEAAREGGLALLLPILILIPASILVVWLVIRRSMSPITDLREAIASKDGGNLQPIELAALPDELTPILESVNRLLDRIRAAMEAERAFTSNSAHEL
ncbi:sensor histidine kinase N-terminal domain-containing protein, partial [Phyllobacterium sp. 0TCS1.6C]